jgi:hypothetical protein
MDNDSGQSCRSSVYCSGGRQNPKHRISLRKVAILSRKNFAAEIVDLICRSSMLLLRALQFPNYWEIELRCVHILKCLVLQAVQLNPGAVIEGQHPLSSTHLHDAVDDEDWFRILN